MGVFGYFLGKACLVVYTVGCLTASIALAPVNPPLAAVMLGGAEAGAAMLASPVDPVSTTTAVLTTAI